MMRTTVERLIREGRSNTEQPLRVCGGPAQHAKLQELKKQIRGEGTSVELSKWSKREMLVVELRVQGHRRRYGYYPYHQLRVYFEGDELRVGMADEEKDDTPCSGLDQLERTLAALRERLTDEDRRAQKSEKLRKLKERAVETHIETLAARHGYTYATEAMHAKVKLFVALDEKESIAVDVPHNRFEAVLEELPALVKAVRDIHARGFRYAIVQRDHYYPYKRPGSKVK